MGVLGRGFGGSQDCSCLGGPPSSMDDCVAKLERVPFEAALVSTRGVAGRACHEAGGVRRDGHRALVRARSRRPGLRERLQARQRPPPLRRCDRRPIPRRAFPLRYSRQVTMWHARVARWRHRRQLQPRCLDGPSGCCGVGLVRVGIGPGAWAGRQSGRGAGTRYRDKLFSLFCGQFRGT